jgi:manganese/zinc/iron transport system permease protein
VTQAQVEIQLVAAIVAAACALPGVFLVLRRMALMSDAISHAILLGIVVAFFATGDLTSPWLVLGAAATGVFTVWLVELLHRSGRVREDAAIGLVFPALFSIGVILISRYAGNVHLDTDAVLLGELAFAPFNRLNLSGTDLGPISLWVMGGITLISLTFIGLFYKELQVASFDPGLAAAMGLSPVVIHYGLMTLVSVTAVGAFDAVGSILVVALMIAPPATAYLLTDRLPTMLVLSVAAGVVAAVGGYWWAHYLDASIAGAMATMSGALFFLVFMVSPRHGLLAALRRRLMQRWDFACVMLTIHLFHHEGTPEADRECRLANIPTHLRWNVPFAEGVARRAQARGLVRQESDMLYLTEAGRFRAREAMSR